MPLWGERPGAEQEGQGVDPTGLGLPANLQVFGNVDPNVRKATAIVNEAVITRMISEGNLTLDPPGLTVPVADLFAED